MQLFLSLFWHSKAALPTFLSSLIGHTLRKENRGGVLLAKIKSAERPVGGGGQGGSCGKGSCPLIRETLGSYLALTHWLTGAWASGVLPPAPAVLGWLAARNPEVGFATSSWAPS